MNRKLFCVLSVVLIIACAGNTLADETAVQGRALLAEHGAKVVTVELIIKETSSYGDYEYTQETFGTIISPEGLIVCSLMATDPAQFMEQMNFGGEGESQMETKVAGIKVIFNDNTEKEGQIVLRDKDLDLAFLRLKEKPENPLPFIDLKSAQKTELFEEVFFITRLGKVAKRMASLYISRILGILEKPRLLYIVGGFNGDGEAAFTADGKLLGILVTRSIPPTNGAYDGMDMVGVIIPGADVQESAEQAPLEAPKEQDAVDTETVTPKDEEDPGQDA